MAKKPSAPDYFWFQPLRVLFEEAGEFNDRFQFWQFIVGGSESQDLIYTDAFCALGEPFAPDWTFDNFVAYGTHNCLILWAQREMYRRYCDTGGGA